MDIHFAISKLFLLNDRDLSFAVKNDISFQNDMIIQKKYLHKMCKT